jgi:phosphatidylserine/phosphatidylglycerophosphate/cardiolipin synthase-like enzyme
MAFDWSSIASYRTGAGGTLLTGNDPRYVTLFSPQDGEGIHKLLVDLASSVTLSYVGNMYGFDDDEVSAALIKLTYNPRVYFQQSLDKSQAGGVHERKLLALLPQNLFGTSIAVGTSIKHAISHLKVAIFDGIITVSGSTNWSLSGEQLQDNELTVSCDPVRAAQFRAQLDLNHSAMVAQMAAARLKGSTPGEAASSG